MLDLLDLADNSMTIFSKETHFTSLASISAYAGHRFLSFSSITTFGSSLGAILFTLMHMLSSHLHKVVYHYCVITRKKKYCTVNCYGPGNVLNKEKNTNVIPITMAIP